jgi:5-methylcytosine-specific restriction endonuclease McrA
MNRPKAKTRPWSVKRPDVKPMQERNSNEFYHTARWTRESRRYRQEYPLCRRCEEKGLVVPSEVVDHIVPMEICADPWDRNNWQPLCKKHNIIKSAQDKKMIQQHRKTHTK